MLHWEDDLTTDEAQANKQAGGVATDGATREVKIVKKTGKANDFIFI